MNWIAAVSGLRSAMTTRMIGATNSATLSEKASA